MAGVVTAPEARPTDDETGVENRMSDHVLLAYSALTGTVYVRKRNGQKEAVPEAQVVSVISGYLDDHTLTVTQWDGTKVAYVAQPLRNDGSSEVAS